MKLDDQRLSSHHWLLDGVHQGLREIRATELASLPVEGDDGKLERLLVATDVGLVEGATTGQFIDGFPGMTLDLRLWRDVRLSARVRVDPQHGTHTARVILDLDGRTVSSWSNSTVECAAEFAAAAIAQAAASGR
jgi:hypothetical protein